MFLNQINAFEGKWQWYNFISSEDFSQVRKKRKIIARVCVTLCVCVFGLLTDKVLIFAFCVCFSMCFVGKQQIQQQVILPYRIVANFALLSFIFRTYFFCVFSCEMTRGKKKGCFVLCRSCISLRHNTANDGFPPNYHYSDRF